jgi:hypothetical protein
MAGQEGTSDAAAAMAQAVGAGMHPQLGKSPDQLSPDLQRTLADRMLTDAKGAILSAYGILPAMFAQNAQGPLVREAQRHLAQWILQLGAMSMAEEATNKLGGNVLIDVVRPAQAFDAGGKARALATAKEAGLDGATVQDALKFIDWAE